MAIKKYKRFIVSQNENGFYFLLKFDVLKREYVHAPSHTWALETDAQAYADKLNEEEGIIEIEWEDID